MSFPIGEEAGSSSLQPQCRHFEFAEIELATKNFDESLVIGHGGFGKVYRGIINHESNRVVVAVKRLDSMSSQGATEFWAEIEMLSQLRHCNLVSLIGYCNDRQEMILVYVYMPHGTLADHLHKLDTPLSWVRRLKICIGAARGLDYLHTGTGIKLGITHRDVKTPNILLEKDWAAKISDFGLSKVGPTNQSATYVNTFVKGTFGYLDPDYFSTGRLTRKSDVYAFGVVLLEVLCRKRAVDSSLDEEEWGLVRWVQDSIKKGKLKQIIDPSLKGEMLPKSLKEFARLAERCLHDHPKQRPTMAEVVFTLESILALEERTNNSMHPAGTTIFGLKLPMFFSSPHGDNSVFRRQKGETSLEQANRKGEFAFADIALATNSFSVENQIGTGSFGVVYKGYLLDGREVAIKRGEPSQKFEEKGLASDIETAFLCWPRYKYLVGLVGYCEEREERLLVYEYMKNGALCDHLHDKNNVEQSSSLLNSWEMRIRISLDAARGIEYLHNYAYPPVIHRDIKSSNILLDANWIAKVSDFLLPLIGPEFAGTVGYIDPEYYGINVLTAKSDVYSLGIVLLELLTGRRAIFKSSGNNGGAPMSLVDYAVPAIMAGELVKILDKRVGPPEVNETEAVELVAHTATRCVNLEGKERPTMTDVVVNLERALIQYDNAQVFRRQKSETSSEQANRKGEFAFADIALATYNFSVVNKIGTGSFGVVYKGQLLDGLEVAVKRVKSSQKFQEKGLVSDIEFAFLSWPRHKHLVGLVGYCEEREERLLVYEYMKNGALCDHLHDKNNVEKSNSLLNSWKMRIKIALGAARGIEYLHVYAVPAIIHGHIKSSNILLDADWVAVVSDFGLSLMGPLVVGTVGYFDPEFYELKALTPKSDVYGLGVVLLELLTGKTAIFKSHDNGGASMNLVDYAIPAIMAGKLSKILDKRVGPPEVNEAEAVELVAYTAIHCVNLEGTERPTMTDVVAKLERALMLYDE